MLKPTVKGKRRAAKYDASLFDDDEWTEYWLNWNSENIRFVSLVNAWFKIFSRRYILLYYF